MDLKNNIKKILDNPKELDVEKCIALEFICPGGCQKYMSPPIHQCSTGHSFCLSCYDRMDQCRVCQAPKSAARNFKLEAIHAEMRFTCKYSEMEDGCPFRAAGDQFKDHELYCDYARITCPLRFVTECNWDGLKKDMRVHCTDEHPDRIYSESVQKLICNGFGADDGTCKSFHLFFLYNEVFRCAWDFNRVTGVMKFSIYYMKRRLDEHRFSYKVTFLDGSTEVEGMSLRAPCEFLDSDSEVFHAFHYMSINYDMLKSLCDDKGNLHYIVQIYDKLLLKNLFNFNDL